MLIRKSRGLHVLHSRGLRGGQRVLDLLVPDISQAGFGHRVTGQRLVLRQDGAPHGIDDPAPGIQRQGDEILLGRCGGSDG